MSDHEIRRAFDEAAHPAPGLPRSRAALRRRLLGAHQPAGLPRPRRRLRLYLPAAAATLLAAVLLFQSMPATLASVLRDMEDAYASRAAEGVHYVRQILAWDGEAPVEVEQWWDPRRERLRTVHRSAATGEILGHSISLRGEAFALEGSRFVSRRRVRHPGEDGAAPEGGRPVEASRLAIILRPPGGRLPGGGGEPALQAIVVGDLERGAFSRRTPREILDGLHEEPGLEYLGTEIDDARGAVLHVLRSEPSLQTPSAVLTFPSARLQEVRGLIASAGERARAAPDPVEAFLDALAAPGGAGEGVRAEEARVVKTYRVDASTSRMVRVTVMVTWGEAGRYSVSKRILADTWVEGARSLFDPELYGLQPVAPGKEREPPVPGGL